MPKGNNPATICLLSASSHTNIIDEQPAKRAFTACSRNEIQVTLQVLSGSVPTDLYGHVYLNSPCGTVNNPTPFPKYLPKFRGQIQAKNKGAIDMYFGDAVR